MGSSSFFIVRPSSFVLRLSSFVVLALLLLLIPGVRLAAATALFVVGIFPQSPVHPLAVLTPAPTRETVTFDAHGQMITADVYRPGQSGPHPGIVLYLGANRVGRADVRLINLTDGLARLGFVVLVPDSPELAQGRITRREVDLLAAGFRFLADQPGVRTDRVGLGGFSVGAAISLLAAADPTIADRVRALNLFGTYYDARSFIQAIASETIRVEGMRFPWRPDNLTRTIFRRLLVESLPAQTDRAALADLIADDNARPTGPLAAGGQAAYELLQRPSYDRAGQLIASLPDETASLLHDLSPSTVIGRVRAPLYIMHDQGDHLIPFPESRALVAAVPPDQVRYTELTIFEHVTPRPTAGPVALVEDGIRLGLHLYAFFAQLML